VIAIGKSPCMKKKLEEEKTESEKKSKIILDMYSRKYSTQKIIVEEEVEDKEKVAAKRKVRMNLLQKTITDSNISVVKSKFNNFDDVLMSETVYCEPVKKPERINSKSEINASFDDNDFDDELELTKLEGYFFYVIEEDKEIHEKIWFKLFQKDLCCKFLTNYIKIMSQRNQI